MNNKTYRNKAVYNSKMNFNRLMQIIFLKNQLNYKKKNMI